MNFPSVHWQSKDGAQKEVHEAHDECLLPLTEYYGDCSGNPNVPFDVVSGKRLCKTFQFSPSTTKHIWSKHLVFRNAIGIDDIQSFQNMYLWSKNLKLINFQATLYFKQEHFKTSIPVAITAMLVMYTLNQTVSSKLPQTSTIRFIDVWIIFGHFLHFVILILLILIEHLPKQGGSISLYGRQFLQRISTRNVTVTFARKILPIVEVIFVSSYFVIAHIIYTS